MINIKISQRLVYIVSKSTLEKNQLFEKNCSQVTAGKTMKVTADLLKKAKTHFELVNPNRIGGKYLFLAIVKTP